MPPKTAKAKEKAIQKKVEDATFGMKNKNRSAKVQAQIAGMQQSLRNSDRSTEAKAKQAEREKRMSAKEAKIAYEEEMKRLFNAVPAPKKEEAAPAEDEDAGPKVDADGNYLWTADDFEAVDAGGLLEERLEAEREALKGRTDLTPVTEESFRAWKEKKRLEKEEAEKKRIAKAKATGSGMKGVDLWAHDASLFVDDDDALDEFEREELEAYDLGEEPEEGGAAKPAHVDPAA